MKKTHLYTLALIIALIATAAIVYKWRVLGFPFEATEEVDVWTVQARVSYEPNRGGNKVTLSLPAKTPMGFALLDERFVARNYSNLVETRDSGRTVQWSTRVASGPQALYYRATVVRDSDNVAPFYDGPPTLGPKPEFDEVQAAAMESLLEDVRASSSEVVTYTQELVRRFNDPSASEEVALLRAQVGGSESLTQLLATLLSAQSIPTRVLHGIELGDTNSASPLLPWLAVHNGSRWVPINPRTASDDQPRNLLLWSGEAPPVTIDGNRTGRVDFSISRNLADAMAIAEQRLEVQDANMVRYSLLGLPLHIQNVYRVLLMVPIGAFLMLLLRNIIGIKTFGTFMPVLVALAFRETRLIAGVSLFVLVVGSGLLVRFYLERLRLLLVPRLTAVLIIVVLLMALVSVLAQRLGIEVGLSVALFPMVIMAMAIERMSIAWDERGASHAIREGLGTLLVACLAYLVMSWDRLEYLIFVYPEFLLLLLSATLLIGRYSGYRLTELVRFRSLAQLTSKPPPPAEPPSSPPAAA